MSTLPPMPDTHTYDDQDFVGIVVGAELAGVSENTLRRYGDDGRVQVYRTPGGQRRFKVEDLRNLIKPEPTERVS
jgi:excisionase family DNA binding protein